jgi:hypothetical protein
MAQNTQPRARTLIHTPHMDTRPLTHACSEENCKVDSCREQAPVKHTYVLQAR